jgi:hypothetical protein
MPVRRLPLNPNLDHLKYQAKDLLQDHAAHLSDAAQRLREFHPRWKDAADTEVFAAKLKLSDAQLTIARESGFPSWARLKRRIEQPTLTDRLDLPHHERIEDPAFRRAVDLLDAGDPAGLREHLQRHPKLVTQHVPFEGGNYFRNPTLLDFIAENPIRHYKLPKNIVEIARVILEAGTPKSALNETLMLVATGKVPRESGVQVALIDLLVGYGADPNSAAEAAAVQNEFQSVHALLAHGARMTLPLAAALGRVEDFRRLLPAADSPARHLALALSSQFGHTEIVRLLLDAGENPNRYNPAGGHSHSTPLHQAAGNGHLDTVKLLVERGARLDTKDILFGGTPLAWASYAERTEIEKYLRDLEMEETNKN